MLLTDTFPPTLPPLPQASTSSYGSFSLSPFSFSTPPPPHPLSLPLTLSPSLPSGVHEFVWIISFISFLFLYPSTFNLLEIAAVEMPKLHTLSTLHLLIPPSLPPFPQACTSSSGSFPSSPSSFSTPPPSTSSRLLLWRSPSYICGPRALCGSPGTSFPPSLPPSLPLSFMLWEFCVLVASAFSPSLPPFLPPSLPRRHPQMVGQGLWCAVHTLWMGNSFVLVASAFLMAHHLFG